MAQVLPALYLEIDFWNESKCDPHFDTSNQTPSQALGGRLLASYFDTSGFQSITHDMATKLILQDVLAKNEPQANVVVPVVIHFDEHDQFIASRNKSIKDEDGR